MAEMVVYLNGKFMPYDEAKVGIEDRGFQYADGIYEVIRVYDGKPFRLEDHFDRLEMSAKAIELDLPDLEKLKADAMELLRLNGSREASLYIQVTRGPAVRKHEFPAEAQPTVVMMAREVTGYPQEYRRNGVKAITVPDDRWAKCYIKSVSLLPNVLAKEKAKRAGAYEAIFIRDGFLMEGSHSNVFVVESGVLKTPPLTNYILAGVTRQVVLEIANDLGVPWFEESIPLDRLLKADEVFFTGTVTEIMPVVSIDGKVIGSGVPGPLAMKLHEAFVKVVKGERLP